MIVNIEANRIELYCETENEKDLCQKMLDEGSDFILVSKRTTDQQNTFYLIHTDKRVLSVLRNEDGPE